MKGWHRYAITLVGGLAVGLGAATGSLTPGKSAYFVILERDAIGGPAEEIVHPAIREISARAAALWEREKDEIAARFPKVSRRVAGYKLPHCLRITVGDEASCRRVAHAIGQFKGVK